MQCLEGSSMAHSRNLLEWYDGLYSRTVDLIGDYAGNELFFIEGDSLLLHSFSDETLDFSPGLQLLHATYIVEKFLRDLLQRKCNFLIVFFNNHAHMCIPRNTSVELHSRFLLAREAIIQHLCHNLPLHIPSAKIRIFDTYWKPDFEEYLASTGAYFFMCHDGSFPPSDTMGKGQSSRNGDDDYLEGPIGASQTGLDAGSSSEYGEEVASKDNLEDESPEYMRKVHLRSMIHWFICCGYNIALVTSVECRDTKVMTMILEGSRTAQQPPHIQNTSRQAYDNSLSGVKSEAEILAKLSGTLLHTPEPALTQRALLVVVTLCLMLRSDTACLLEARAMLLHTIALQECRLTDRALGSTNSPKSIAFLKNFADEARHVLLSDAWRRSELPPRLRCDFADLVDGRLFLTIASQLQKTHGQHCFRSTLLSSFNALRTLVYAGCGINLAFEQAAQRSPTKLARTMQGSGFDEEVRTKRDKKLVPAGSGHQVAHGVLPFRNTVFDAHLAPIRLTINESVSANTASRISKELSHWHNHRRLITQRAALGMTEWQKARANRRNQRFMAEMRDYAASLTNAVGGVLEPETIVVASSKVRMQKPTNDSTTTHQAPIGSNSKKISARSGKKQGSKINVKDLAAAAVLERQTMSNTKQIEAWNLKRAGFEEKRNLASRFLMVKGYLDNLAKTKRAAVEAEVLTYMLNILVEIWMTKCASSEQTYATPIVGLLWNLILQLAKLTQGITEDIATCVANTVEALHLPPLERLHVQETRKLSFHFVNFGSRKANLDIELPPLEFQLIHAGPYFDRNIDSSPDARVQGFEPDKWQRHVLDQIDAKNSVFVVAPTSAGKTFISFYAMKQILEDDDDGVIVYVAPTKALVNQIAAEIQARFSKSFKYGAKSVWSIHTRDYRINNPTGCQVLVTVPHMLQIMLLAPANARAWSPRVKRIIFDEIHCIGQADDGVVWEQLLLLAPCPIIALSATVGNQREFSDWLSRTQETNGIHLEMIEHRHRYSDLRKYVYNPPLKFLFNGFSVRSDLPSVGLENAMGLAFMHPVASLVDRTRGMPDDLSLEPRDCWMLWNVMRKHQTDMFPVHESLDPSNCLPQIVRKADVIEWDAKLKALLKTWIENHKSPFDIVLKELESPVRGALRPELQISSGKVKENESPRSVWDMNRLDTTLPLICSLHDQGALPAIFFNYDRNSCEAICKHLLSELEVAESGWKESSQAWKAQVNAWENWKQSQARQAKKKAPKKTKKGVADDEAATTRIERMRDAGLEESSPFESFSPDDPVDEFNLADVQKLTPSELQQYVDELKARDISRWLIDGLRRGIGVHHAGLNRKYRQVCEILFRKGYLRVVIATGTLALGINMPCKTVVFSGDSIFLTALNFRQAAGRAGRRGFDVLGNVVFQGIPYSKVCRLLSSRLPDLNGHFPITTTLVLRLFILLYESKHSEYAVKAINSILSCPRIYMGGPESKHTVLHHLRFSIEYLRRNSLLDASGAPLNFTGCVSHLYYTENASFAFHALLKGGYFGKLCGNIYGEPKKVLLTLMLVMSHLFGRRYLRSSVLEPSRTKRWSSSVVILPPLPEEAANIMGAHNDETLDIYAAYVSTFIDQHVKETDDNLPLTRIKCGGNKSFEEIGMSSSTLSPVRINSAFVALSGHRDEWESVSDLCKMVRSGVWLEEAVVPYVGTYPGGGDTPLNAYLYDFFKHGNIVALEKENGIRKGDIWFVLNDFSLILATIVTSLENFLKLSLTTGTEMLDVMGSGEMQECELDDRVLETELAKEPTTGGSALPVREKSELGLASSKAPYALRKKKVADSWDDEMSDDGSDNDVAIPETIGEALKAKKAEKKHFGSGVTQTKEIEDNGEVLEPRNGEVLKVLKAFTMLQDEFNQKFKAMWS